MRCARCETEIETGKGREVAVEQATAASPTLTVHADPGDCAPVAPTRRYLS